MTIDDASIGGQAHATMPDDDQQWNFILTYEELRPHSRIRLARYGTGAKLIGRTGMKQPHALLAPELALHLALQPYRRVDLGLEPRLARPAADRLGEFVIPLDVLGTRVLADMAVSDGAGDAVLEAHFISFVWGAMASGDVSIMVSKPGRITRCFVRRLETEGGSRRRTFIPHTSRAIGDGGCNTVEKTHVPYLVWGEIEVVIAIRMNTSPPV